MRSFYGWNLVSSPRSRTKNQKDGYGPLREYRMLHVPDDSVSQISGCRYNEVIGWNLQFLAFWNHLKPPVRCQSFGTIFGSNWHVRSQQEFPWKMPLIGVLTVTLNGAVDLNHEFVLFLILVGKHDLSHHLPTIYPPFPNLSIPAALKPAWYPMSSGKGGGGGPGSPCTRHISAVWKPLYGYGSIPMKIPFLVGWTSINPSYFDVNRRGTIGFDTLPYN